MNVLGYIWDVTSIVQLVLVLKVSGPPSGDT